MFLLPEHGCAGSRLQYLSEATRLAVRDARTADRTATTIKAASETNGRRAGTRKVVGTAHSDQMDAGECFWVLTAVLD